MRLIGSFQTMTIQGRSCSTSSAPRGCSTSTSAGASVVTSAFSPRGKLGAGVEPHEQEPSREDVEQLFAAMSNSELLATRSGARLEQAQSAAEHTRGHLQLVGVGEWRPRTTRPSWASDPRVVPDE